MVKRPPRKPRDQWAPKREPDDPPLNDPGNPFAELADENPTLAGRIWLYPEREAEPSTDRWIAAIVAADQRKDQAPLAALLKSDHPLQGYARRHLANFIDRHQERDSLASLLTKLPDTELSQDDRLVLAAALQQPWKKTQGNRLISYEIGNENEALGRAEADVHDLIGQGQQLRVVLDRHRANGLSLEQALYKVKDRIWIDKDTPLRERLAELKFQNLNPKQIKDRLIGEGWTRDGETIAEVLTSKTLDDLARQRGWTSKEVVPERTVGQAVLIKLGDVRTLEEAVARLTSQHWTVDEAVDRVAKWWGIPNKQTLLDYCNKGRSSLRDKFNYLSGPKK
jgi:hypothetical protein